VLEKIPTAPPKKDSARAMLTGGSVPTAATAAEPAHTSTTVGWDPYDVWRTRVLQPRLSAARAAAPPERSMTPPASNPDPADDTGHVPHKPDLAVTFVSAAAPRPAQTAPSPKRRAFRPLSQAVDGNVVGWWAVAVSVAFALSVGTDRARTPKTER
jgi:hypothetical protein